MFHTDIHSLWTDHNLSADKLKNMGIKVWQPYLDENKTQKMQFGGFSVRSFDVPHDDEPCCGFLIEHSGEKLLYATDLEYCKYVFAKMKLDHILIECNYQHELVDKDLPNYEHKIKGHLSLSTCKEIIRVNATDKLKTVILCHLGQDTTNPSECVAEVQKVVNSGVYVDYARKGFEVELRTDKCPF